MKKYIEKLPTLVAPRARESLIIYFAASRECGTTGSRAKLPNHGEIGARPSLCSKEAQEGGWPDRPWSSKNTRSNTNQGTQSKHKSSQTYWQKLKKKTKKQTSKARRKRERTQDRGYILTKHQVTMASGLV
nr:hypothetical protein [Tanacetum cinerariifolium]